VSDRCPLNDESWGAIKAPVYGKTKPKRTGGPRNPSKHGAQTKDAQKKRRRLKKKS